MKLLTAKLIIEHESCPNLAYLGRFVNEDPGQRAITDSEAFVHKPKDSTTLKYFISSPPRTDADRMLENIKELYRENYDRMLAYEYGDWHMVQIHLEIRIEIGGAVQKIVSETSHNVPSDCDCMGEYAEDMLDELGPVLKKLGFSVKDVLEFGLEI